MTDAAVRPEDVTEDVTDEVTEETDEEESDGIPEVSTLPELAQTMYSASAPLWQTITDRLTYITRGENRGKLLGEAVSASEDAKVMALVAQIAKANENILAWQKEAESIVAPTLEIPSEDDVKAAEDLLKKDLTLWNSYDTVFKSQLANAPELPDDISLDLNDYHGAFPRRRGTATKQAASGIQRPRFSSVEWGEGVNPESVNFVRVGDDKNSNLTHFAVALRQAIPGIDLEPKEILPEILMQNNLQKDSDWRLLPDSPNLANFVRKGDDGKDHNVWVRVTK